MDSDVCPDEAAVETSAFDDVFVSQIDLYPLGGGGGGGLKTGTKDGENTKMYM